MLKAVGGDLAGQIELLLFDDLGLRWQDFAQPLDHAADDLADASLRYAVAVSQEPSGLVPDVDGFVDFEVAVGGREFAGRLEGFGHGILLKRRKRKAEN